MKYRAAIIAFAAFLLSQPASALVSGGDDEPLRDTVRIESVVVTGTRASETARSLPMSVSVVTEKEMDSRMEQSVLPLLSERVPSLMITSRGLMGYGSSSGAAGGMTMRGVGSSDGSSGSVLVLIDGHPQFMGIFSHPVADTYQTIMAERVEVVRGPASVLYGSNAIGGVINILTRQQREDGVNTHLRAMYGSYNTISADAVNMLRAGKFNSVLSLAYNRSDGHRENMEFEQYSGYAKVGYDFSRNWKSFADFNLSKAYSSNPGLIDSPMFDNDMDILRGVASFSVENRYDRISGALKIFYNFGDHFIDDGYREGGNPRDSRFNSTDWMLGMAIFQNYNLRRGNKTTVGFDLQRYGGHAWTSYIDRDDVAEIAEEYLNDMAGYVNFQQLLWDRLTLNAGVRLDHHSEAGSEWIPQFGLSWFAGRNTTVKAIVSKGYRNPSMRELYMWRPANPDLEPERLRNYEVSATQYFFGRRLWLEMNLYYINGDNSIIMVPIQNEDGTSSSRFMNTGRIENYGLEFSASFMASRNLGLNSNYSYLQMKYEIVGSPEHKLYAGADYSLKKWTFSTGLQYVGNLVLDEEFNKGSFVLWNARISYKVTRGLDIFVRGENLLNQKYSYYTGYPMPGTTVLAGVSLKL